MAKDSLTVRASCPTRWSETHVASMKWRALSRVSLKAGLEGSSREIGARSRVEPRALCVSVRRSLVNAGLSCAPFVACDVRAETPQVIIQDPVSGILHVGPPVL
ncbi:hypothetical protein Taro_026923 [Colocasia esculenta]|uniref:Uncharacterized protein n=1 Tax=Colocasia esculenta TaxID=4460 RepID=A0A843VGK2_COLES|nr:hypothetical protein [Colocasia esculenta]